MSADYRDATSALGARLATLEAELGEIEVEVGSRREVRDGLSAEARSLEGALRWRSIERVLLAALMAPAAGGLGMIVTLTVAGMAGGLVFGEKALPIASVIAVFGGLLAGYRAVRQLRGDGAKDERAR